MLVPNFRYCTKVTNYYGRGIGIPSSSLSRASYLSREDGMKKPTRKNAFFRGRLRKSHLRGIRYTPTNAFTFFFFFSPFNDGGGIGRTRRAGTKKYSTVELFHFLRSRRLTIWNSAIWLAIGLSWSRSSDCNMRPVLSNYIIESTLVNLLKEHEGKGAHVWNSFALPPRCIFKNACVDRAF